MRIDAFKYLSNFGRNTISSAKRSALNVYCFFFGSCFFFCHFGQLPPYVTMEMIIVLAKICLYLNKIMYMHINCILTSWEI